MSIYKHSYAAVAALLISTGPAFAQDQKGLVNINVDNNTVQVPVGVAAQVCPDVDANVLAEQFVGTEDIACTITQDVAAEHNIGGGSPGAGAGNDGGQQEGLVNVNVDNNTVQIPVGVAAQVCPDVDANVLAQQFVGTEDIACTITQDVAAEHNIGGGSPGAGAEDTGTEAAADMSEDDAAATDGDAASEGNGNAGGNGNGNAGGSGG